MSIETLIPTLLADVAGDTVYPDVAPAGLAAPYVVWQQVGGRTWQYLEGGMPDLREARIQFACWATTRLSANDLMRDIEAALVSSPTCAEAAGALVADHDPDTGLYGARQDFYLRWR